MKQNKKTQSGYDVDASYAAWANFKQVAERFEKQRIACDSGLAFVFMEGALVDAIRTGKWYVLLATYYCIYLKCMQFASNSVGIKFLLVCLSIYPLPDYYHTPL